MTQPNINQPNAFYYSPSFTLEPFPTPMPPSVAEVGETKDRSFREGIQPTLEDVAMLSLQREIIQQPRPQNGDRRGRRG